MVTILGVPLQKNIMENTIDWAKYKGSLEEGKVRLLKEGAENGNALCQFG